MVPVKWYLSVVGLQCDERACPTVSPAGASLRLGGKQTLHVFFKIKPVLLVISVAILLFFGIESTFKIL